MLQRFRARLRSLWNLNRQESELEEEIRFHLSEEADERVAGGLSPEQARFAAKRDFGNVTSIRARTRDVWVWPWLQDVGHDIRFAARLLIKDGRFTLAVATVLALGIGANTAVFTIVNAVFLRGLPFHEPDRILRLWTINERGQRRPPRGLDLEHWREAPSLSDLAGYDSVTINVSDGGLAPQRLRGSYVTANLFPLIGQRPVIGREFGHTDDRPGAQPVTLLSHSIWQNRYGGDAAVLGRTLKANGQIFTVVGVMPPDMRFPDDVDIWFPSAQIPLRTGGSRSTTYFQAIARLAVGATLEQARVELSGISERLEKEFPDTNVDLKPYVWPYNEWTVDGGQFRILFLLLQGAVPFVLLIACANAANLLLARSTHRAQEVAVRVALGASRPRVVRQLLVESALLALLAGLAGFGLAVAGVRWAGAAMQNVGMPYYMDFTIDGIVFAFMASVCLAAGLLFGLAPALHVSKTDVNHVLKEGGRGGSGGLRARRWTGALIVTEIALTIVLLAGAGFMMRSFLTLYRLDLGIDSSKLLTMRMYLPSSTYDSAAQQTELFRQLEDRLAGIHEIEASTLTNRGPLEGGNPRRVSIDGRAPSEESPATVMRLTVGDGYFDTLGAQLVRGRAFTSTDGSPGQETVIVNERFAATHFPDGNPLGRRIVLDREGGPATTDRMWLTIVGVSTDVRQSSHGDSEPNLVAYLPYRSALQRNWSLILRTRGDPAAVTAFVREAVRDVDPDLPVFNIQTMDQQLAQYRWQFRVFSSMFAIFAVIALVLSAVGLYALTSYSVKQRTHELGLRVVLGAQSGQVQWLVLRQAVVHLLIGLPIGLAGAFGVGWLLNELPRAFRAMPLLMETSPADPVTLLSIVAVLGGAAVLACLWPARRAARLNPIVALRHE